MENDTAPGGEGLSIDEAVAAYVKSTEAEAVPEEDHAEEEVEGESTQTDDELQTSEEDASEEADGETESEEHTAEDEDGEPESEGGRFVADDAKVRLADGTVTTVHELKRGFLREADYTRKTQEASALHSETAAERERVKASEQQIAEQREYVATLLQALMPQPPDPALLQTDPQGYLTQRAQYEQYAAHLQNIQQQSEAAKKAQADEAAGKLKEKAAKEWELTLDAMPELKDEKRLHSFAADLQKYGAQYGFTREELAQAPNDHRHLVVLKKAMAWDKLQASKGNVAKKVEGRPPVQKGGKRLSPGAHKAREATDAMNRLKETGSVDDAVRAYLATKG